MKLQQEKIFQIALDDFQKIQQNLMPFPIKNSKLVTCYQKQPLSKNIQCVDPSGTLFLSMLQQHNRNEVTKMFTEVQKDILQLMESNYQDYLQLESFCFLQGQIQSIVNKKIKGMKFKLYLYDQHTQKWEKQKQEKYAICKEIYSKMQQFYEINTSENDQWEDSQQIFQPHQELPFKKIYQSKIEMQTNQSDEGRQLDKQAANLHSMSNKQTVKHQTHRNEMKKRHSINIPMMVSNKKEEKFEQKYSHFIPRHYQYRKFKSNLLNTPKLSWKKIDQVNKLIKQSSYFLKQYLTNKFTSKQRSKIWFSLKKSITNQSKHLVGSETQAWKIKKSLFYQYSCILQKVISDIKITEELSTKKFQDYNPYLVLLVLFYKKLNHKYTSLTKRYLQKICQILQAKQTHFYLRGALKIIQNAYIQPSQLAQQLARLPPERWSEHQLSNKSCLQQDNYLASDPKKVKSKIDNYVKNNQTKLLKANKIIPQIQFVKLNYSLPTKVVTIAISGFGSQDTCKYLEWKGLAQDYKDNQLYALYWKSSTYQEMKNYLVQLGIKVAGSLLSYSGLLLFIMKTAGHILATNKLNPFTKAINWTKQTGYTLTDFIIDNFSDRYIILVGFSLGTMVIYYCLQRLAQRGRLDLIHQVVTLGGVVGQQDVQQFLKQAKYPLHWINFESDRDWTVNLGTVPIGAGGLRSISGHELINLQMGKIISGHTEFRCFLRGLMRMIGLHHH